MNKFMPKPTFLMLLAMLYCISCKEPQKKNLNTGNGEFWLNEMTISMLQKGYKEGKFTVSEVVSAYISRISEIDKAGPSLNSIIVLNPDAMQIAGELDRQLKQGEKTGPLFGVPVILKDNIDTHDRMATTAGATVLRNSIAPADSYVARKLREAGAVILLNRISVNGLISDHTSRRAAGAA
jgi:amidase